MTLTADFGAGFSRLFLHESDRASSVEAAQLDLHLAAGRVSKAVLHIRRLQISRPVLPFFAGDSRAFAPLLPFQTAALEQAERLAAVPGLRVLLASDTALFDGMDHGGASLALPAELSRALPPRPGGDSLFHAAALTRAGQARRVLSVHLAHPICVAAFQDGIPVFCSGGYSGIEHFPSQTASGAVDPGLLFLAGADPRDGLHAQPAGLAALEARGAGFARDWLAHHLALECGKACVAMGGLDLLVAGGGSGEDCRPQLDALLARFHPPVLDLAGLTKVIEFDLHRTLVTLS